MENPTFKLEGIVRSRDEMEDFEGPLALILLLLSKNKVEIRDIRIAEILDQYLEYLEQMKRMDLEVASEFVVMASHLVYIKAKTLLTPENEEITELEQLIASLEELSRKDSYAKIRAVTDDLGDLFSKGSAYIAKLPETISPDKEYKYAHEKDDLTKALRELVRRGDSLFTAEPERMHMARPILYSIDRKSDEILTRLRAGEKLDVDGILMQSESRTELVATFISLLELCRNGSIYLTEDEGTLCITLGSAPLPADRGEGEENGNL